MRMRDELEQKVAALAKRVSSLPSRGFEPAPAEKDARQVWGRVASELERRGMGMLVLAASEASVEEHDDALVMKVSAESALRILRDPAHRKAIAQAAEVAGVGKPVVIEEVRKIEEDKVLPYLTNMFGKSLEIK